jgi:hypothetical protein
LRTELRRSAEFAEHARNRAVSLKLNILARQHGIDDFEIATERLRSKTMPESRTKQSALDTLMSLRDEVVQKIDDPEIAARLTPEVLTAVFNEAWRLQFEADIALFSRAARDLVIEASSRPTRWGTLVKIVRLRLENFGPFMGVHEIDLTVTTTAPVILIHGENERGKTSLANAIRWCLYTGSQGSQQHSYPDHETSK